jgi:hypothetical protein
VTAVYELERDFRDDATNFMMTVGAEWWPR